VADAAFRFFERFVEPNRSALSRYDPARVWGETVAPHLNAYMGHEFERIAAEAFLRKGADSDLPMVSDWGRWEGQDRQREPVEIDIVAPQVGGGMLTGEVKWDRQPISASVHARHIDKLQRMADAGRSWAHEALLPSSRLLYVAAGGFDDGFREAVEADEREVLLWTLRDVYPE
jgi:hypothetical protein